MEKEFKVNEIVISKLNYVGMRGETLFTKNMDYKIEKIENDEILLKNDFETKCFFQKEDFSDFFRKQNWFEKIFFK